MTDHVQQPSPPPTQDLNQTALDIILVVVETLLALLLRFDADLRQKAYPLVKANTVVCVRSYVPHVTIYATFTVNGILLDRELNPSQTVDITINGFSVQILQAIVSHKPSVIDDLQFRGEIDKVSLLKEFLLTIGVAKLVRTLIASFTGKKSKTDNEKPKTSIYEYKNRIAEQEQQINTLTIQQTEYTATIAELKSQNKILKIALAVIGLLLVISVMFF